MKLRHVFKWWLILRAIAKLQREQEKQAREKMRTFWPTHEAFNKRPKADPVALRLAERTPATYDYCLRSLQLFDGDERAAEAWIVMHCADPGRG